ncbi:MAG: nucleotidyl transferase AbiEii/AbiGii toxin family protein [Planctomycetota bacterium]
MSGIQGGTSPSKVHGIIKRFSEDIDLSVSPDFLNLHEVREQGVAKPINGWPGLRLPAGFLSKPGSCLSSNP